MKSIYLFLFTLLLFNGGTAQTLGLQQVASGFSIPVEMGFTADGRIFIVEKAGKIKIIENGTVLPTPFLDITNLVNSTSNERGFLGLAFHPNFATNNLFYVHYSNLSGSTTIARYTASGNVANPSSGTVLLNVTQPFSNHNGGRIEFDSNGYLCIGLGDGGSGGDPYNNGQNGNSLLGKILRIDVDNGSPYGIPADNPFVGNANVADEIYTMGMRNPWKFSFDASNQEIWIADVGQNAIEEINHVTNASGLNFGWRCYEGNSVYNNNGCGASSQYTFPVATYSHTSGRCSITGGFVYRGTEYPNMVGKYFFGDYCSGEIGMIDPADNSLTWKLETSYYISSFGTDSNGNLYVVDINGSIHKIKDLSLGVEDVENSTIEISLNNPVQTELHIQSNKTWDEISLYSLEGKWIRTVAYSPNQEKIEVGDLPSGVYLLQIIFDGGNKIVSKKLIKQ